MWRYWYNSTITAFNHFYGTRLSRYAFLYIPLHLQQPQFAAFTNSERTLYIPADSLFLHVLITSFILFTVMLICSLLAFWCISPKTTLLIFTHSSSSFFSDIARFFAWCMRWLRGSLITHPSNHILLYPNIIYQTCSISCIPMQTFLFKVRISPQTNLYLYIY